MGHTQNEDKRWDKSVRHPVQSLSVLLLHIWSPKDCRKIWICYKHIHKITYTYYPITYTHTHIHTYISFIHKTISGIQHSWIQHTYLTYLLSCMPFINIKTKRHRHRAPTPQTVPGTYINLYPDTHVYMTGIHNHYGTSRSHIQITSFLCPL